MDVFKHAEVLKVQRAILLVMSKVVAFLAHEGRRLRQKPAAINHLGSHHDRTNHTLPVQQGLLPPHNTDSKRCAENNGTWQAINAAKDSLCK